MVVSTQQPDLAWMKSPRLAQLLEEATPEVNSRSSHQNHTPNHTPTEVKNAELAEQKLSPEESKSDPETTPPRIFGLPRKRSSSLRDSMEVEESGRGSVGEEQEVMGIVLQEADSTTIEHASQPLAPPLGVSLATPLPPGQLTLMGQSEGVAMESEPCADSEKPLGSEDTVKKVRCVETREDGVVSPGRGVVSPSGGVADDESSVSSGGGGEEEEEGEGLEGGATLEAEQKKETYKEEATGQMESESLGE